ncbi:MAG: HemK/PrmC family methyltransferase [bacterium]
MLTIKTILTKYPPKLSKISSTPKLDVEVLLSFAIKKPKEFLYTYPEYKLTKKQKSKFNAAIKRRLKNEPIAYIIGEKEFYGLNFTVSKITLIPRPETELIVEQAIQEIKKSKNQKINHSPLSQRGGGGIFSPLRRSLSSKDCDTKASQKVGELFHPPAEGDRGRVSNQQITLLDIGTGSGCIPISIIKNLPKDIRKKIKIYAIDISPKALISAKKNARLHGVEKDIKFIKNDLLQQRGGLASIMEAKPPRCLIITANLPYISTSAYKKLTTDIKKYEPKNALIAGSDGLKYYRKLFKQIQKITPNKPPSRGGVGGGLNIILLIEIDFKTMCSKEKLEKTIKQYLPNSKIEIKKDLSGAERIVMIRL